MEGLAACMLTLVVKAIHPRLRHGLLALDRADVVRFAVVIPSIHFDERDRVTMLDEEFPAFGQEPVVASVYEVLVIRVRTVVLRWVEDLDYECG